MTTTCSVKCGRKAVLKRPKTGDFLCMKCFFNAFEKEVHYTIINGKLFDSHKKVAIGASGGKDSTVLAYVLDLLNKKHNYGLELILLSIDEGITGYRDDSLATVEDNSKDYQLPLVIQSYKDLYGWTMDEIVKQVGRKNNCTFCGVFRRHALDYAVEKINNEEKEQNGCCKGSNNCEDKAKLCIATGHNADDIAETVLMNVLRGDIARLQRCTATITGDEDGIPRCKPLKYSYEKEIVMYAHFKKLKYFSTECIYAPNAYRGYAREFLKDLEKIRPSSIIDIIHSGERLQVKENIKLPERGKCTMCGFMSSQEICKACVLLEGLNRGLPKLGIGKSSKARQILSSKSVKTKEQTLRLASHVASAF